MVDLATVALQTATFDADGTRGFVLSPPIESEEFVGVYEFERALCRPIRPEDLRSVDLRPDEPVFDRLWKVLQDMFESFDLLDTVKAFVSFDAALKGTFVRIATDPLLAREFAEAVLSGYSDYVRDGMKGTFDLLLGAWNLLRAYDPCRLQIHVLSVAGLVAAVHPNDDIPWGPLLGEASIQCPHLYPVLLALQKMNMGFRVVRDEPELVLGAMVELMGEVLLAIAEVVHDAKMREYFQKFASNPVLIGRAIGAIVGFVIWDIVVDELLTLGFGKATRGLRWLIEGTQ